MPQTQTGNEVCTWRLYVGLSTGWCFWYLQCIFKKVVGEALLLLVARSMCVEVATRHPLYLAPLWDFLATISFITWTIIYLHQRFMDAALRARPLANKRAESLRVQGRCSKGPFWSDEHSWYIYAPPLALDCHAATLVKAPATPRTEHLSRVLHALCDSLEAVPLKSCEGGLGP